MKISALILLTGASSASAFVPSASSSRATTLLAARPDTMARIKRCWRSGTLTQSHCPQKEHTTASIGNQFTKVKLLPDDNMFTTRRPNSPKCVTLPQTATSYMPEALLPPKRNREANSTHRLSRLDIQRASTDAKRFVEARLEKDFNLVKHTTPLAFTANTGVNDDLDGTESKRAVSFSVPNRDIPRGITIGAEQMKERPPFELECEVVQSLAKWKRFMLDRLGCEVGEGIYCDSTSIRKGYKGDVTHSAIADQWDFEVRINEEDRTVETLKDYVTKIWKIITDCEEYILAKYPDILLEGHPSATRRLPKELTFLTSQELHEMFPTLGVHERETAAVKLFGAIFIIGMGWPMADGTPAEEVRSPGYDDWHLNGDIIVEHPLTEYRHELMSTGIRVNSESLRAQLAHRGMDDQAELPFMKAVLTNRLPFCFGGGIGISRLLMLLLRTCHIGEVQCGVWHDEHFKQAAAAGIDLIPDRLVEI